MRLTSLFPLGRQAFFTNLPLDTFAFGPASMNSEIIPRILIRDFPYGPAPDLRKPHSLHSEQIDRRFQLSLWKRLTLMPYRLKSDVLLALGRIGGRMGLA